MMTRMHKGLKYTVTVIDVYLQHGDIEGASLPLRTSTSSIALSMNQPLQKVTKATEHVAVFQDVICPTVVGLQ